MTVEDIVDFGRRFDPQKMHTDVHAAERCPTGGLIARGMHTASLCVRLLVDHLSRVTTLPSPGISDPKFRKPVCLGDQLAVRTETIRSRTSQSNPTRGVVTTLATMFTLDDSPVADMMFVHLIRRRSDVMCGRRVL